MIIHGLNANFGVILTKQKVAFGLHTILRLLRWMNERYIHIQNPLSLAISTCIVFKSWKYRQVKFKCDKNHLCM